MHVCGGGQLGTCLSVGSYVSLWVGGWVGGYMSVSEWAGKWIHFSVTL